MMSGQERDRGDEMVRDWYAFDPANDNGPSVIGMSDWLEAPAGLRGGVCMVGDHFEFEDGTHVKFWGVNVCSGQCAPDTEAAEFWAARLAKYGVNCVRMHKFIPPAPGGVGSPEDSTMSDPEALDRFDYFHAALRRQGIYYGWSFVFHQKVRPADRSRLIAYDEIIEGNDGEISTLVNYAEDIQNLRLAMEVNLLAHQNPHTGLTYAEDPALAFVELQNEDDVFFCTGKSLEQCPTYLRMFTERFSDWLRQKYGTHEDLVRAWGEGALNIFDVKDEHLDRRNIHPMTNSTMMGPEMLPEAEQKGIGRRVLDTARFLHDVQNAYYARFLEAVREVGYEGPLVGSCWRGRGGITEYYNIRSDSLIGFIDRHNYHIGLSGTNLYTGEFRNAAMVSKPGSGLFSTGFLRVIDRPYALSEWNTVFPNEWALEAAAIIAIYGLGLQDWDGSYQFSCTTKGRGFADALHTLTKLWCVERPDQMGLYPVLARLIYRGDVEAGPLISVRRVSVQELEDNSISFGSEHYWSQGDVRVYDGPIPTEALAAGRVAIEFVAEPQESTMPDVATCPSAGVVTSGTGQLVWDASEDGRGFFTVDTPGTKAVVGFADNRVHGLGDVTITLETPFAGVFLTSLDRHEPMGGADSLLLVALARTRNTDMRFGEAGDTIEEFGGPPIILEPVRAEISLRGRPIECVRLLDHDGCRTDATLPVTDGRFSIDGAVDRTMYYEIVLGDDPL